MWHIRNTICFENKHVKSPTEIICMICSFLTYWAGLLKGDFGQQVIQVAEAVKMMALYFHKQEMQSQDQDERQLKALVWF